MTQAKRPNFLIIVADDLGFSDTSPYGGEIDTPNLQKLAEEGVRMTGFHTAASCSPTRSMLLSGTDAHIAGLGAMAERMGRFPEIFQDKPGYEGYLNYRVAALPEILQDNGYHTVMSGKWHLGLTLDTAPHARGFSRVFGYLPGAGNHYHHEPQLYDEKEPPRPNFMGNGLWVEDGRWLDGAPGGDIPEDFYSTRTFTDNLLKYLDERTDSQREQPFFAYLPFTAPHWPLQAPAETVNKYRGKYNDGPNALRDRRLKSLVEKGIVPADVEPAPMHMLGTTPWADLPEDKQRESSRAMEVFAAMVDLIDVNIGRVREHLERTGEWDNTFVVFMSDNGAEGQLLEAAPILPGLSMAQMIDKYYNNSIENMGNYDSFVWYGPQWASAATAPSRGLKSYTTEGGIHCPCIIRYPPGIPEAARGSITPTFTTVMDILPTMLDLAGVKHPGSTFRGRQVAPVRGKSWRALLENPTDASVQIYDSEKDIVGWEQLGIAAVRVGDWKALFLPPPRGEGKWELYNVAKDPGEVHDLSEKEPAKMEEMLMHYNTYFQESGLFDSYAMWVDKMKADGATRVW
ncbi:uncharacterized protein E0L32_007572 [Thyridium curvatum]|uniref:Sulfatase N-terminal domain-containing protein n=1 Tax=Thyridium curvatum TaxID=1093900 RepID=A0A507AMC8_9PEZI|nr:uncharacterized protein E0L32_007572 [Thyridium curvatum]TPX11835.1 hypothetical protein E0L32_007572 [Thyridium curvatum]